jgi:hypothetical protein
VETILALTRTTHVVTGLFTSGGLLVCSNGPNGSLEDTGKVLDVVLLVVWTLSQTADRMTLVGIVGDTVKSKLNSLVY